MSVAPITYVQQNNQYLAEQAGATADVLNKPENYYHWDKKTNLPIGKVSKKLDTHVEKVLDGISKIPGAGVASYFLPTHGGGLGSLYKFSSKFFDGSEGMSQMALLELNSVINYLASGKSKNKFKNIFGYDKKSGSNAIDTLIKDYSGKPDKLLQLSHEVGNSHFGSGENIFLSEKHINLLKEFRAQGKREGFDSNDAWSQFSKRNGSGTQPMSILTFMVLPFLAQFIPTDSITDALDENNSKKAGLLLGASSLLQGSMSLEVGRNALQAFNTKETPWGPAAKLATILSHFVQPLLGSALLMYDPQANDMFAGTPYEKKSKDLISSIGNAINSGLQLLTPASLILFGYPHLKEYKKDTVSFKYHKKEDIHQKYKRRFNKLMGPGQIIGAGVYFASLIVQKIAEHFKNNKLHELDDKYHINDTIKQFDQKKKALMAEYAKIAQAELLKLHKEYPALPQDKLIEKAKENAMKVMKPKVEALQKEYEQVGTKIRSIQADATENYDRFIWMANVAQKIAFLGIDVSMFFGHIADPMRGLVGLAKARQVTNQGLTFGKAVKQAYKHDISLMAKILAPIQGTLGVMMPLTYLKLLTDEGSPFALKPGEDAEKTGGLKGMLHGLTHNKAVELYEQYGWMAGMG